jgi:hypothetical protein
MARSTTSLPGQSQSHAGLDSSTEPGAEERTTKSLPLVDGGESKGLRVELAPGGTGWWRDAQRKKSGKSDGGGGTEVRTIIS